MITAGVDEVGRGCLAGPVVSAAVILKDSIDLKLLKDSKKIPGQLPGRGSLGGNASREEANPWRRYPNSG